MIPRLKRQTKKRHSAERVYRWTLTLTPVLPIIGAPITPDIGTGIFTVTGTPSSKRAIRRARRLTPDVWAP